MSEGFESGSTSFTRFWILVAAVAMPGVFARVYGFNSIPFALWEYSLLLLWPGTRSTIFIALVLISISWIRLISQLFGFEQPFIGTYYLVANSGGFPLWLQVLIFAAVLLYVATMAWLVRTMPQQVRIFPKWSAALIFLGTLLVVRLVTPASFGSIVGTNLGHAWGQFQFSPVLHQEFRLGSKPMPNFPTSMATTLALSNGASVNLILVESLGVAIDSQDREALSAHILTPDTRHRLHISGTTEAYGSTLHGELRELCAGFLEYGLLGQHPEAHCIPNLMRRHGYSTEAFHANRASMYGRDRWYPRIGFAQYDHVDPASSQTIHRGQWGGATDLTALPTFFDMSKRQQAPAFRYFLTISTHLPVIALDGTVEDESCIERLGRAVCQHEQNMRKVFDTIATVVRQYSDEWFVVVGDHPPPFLRPGERKNYMDRKVPYWIFSPLNGERH